ncbi:hypothetical protein [Streptomyces pseudovenezuelae]|uniref:hypothetical protein n=1 Tax=Streptomyces pseudovenezuelae TaxID=67350 RepID=UPI0036E959CE
MSVLGGSGLAVDLLAQDAAAAAYRDVLELPAAEVVELAAPFVVGEPMLALAAAVLQEKFVDRYAAAVVLGVKPPAVTS